MEYRGSYSIFDMSRVTSYPLSKRANKVELENAFDPKQTAGAEINWSEKPWYRNGCRGDGDNQSDGITELAKYIVECRKAGRPVIILHGGHPVKNGFSRLWIDLFRRGMVTLLGTNGSATIHAFELALTGASSESVRDALPKGEFGMAFETGRYLNYAIKVGDEHGLGYGESMGKLFTDSGFRKEVLDMVFADFPDTGEYIKPYDGFKYAEDCIFGRAYQLGVKVCVFASIGTDIIDQHPGLDGAAKGRSVARDFMVFTEEMCRMREGGVILNIGTAVMGPEITLKAVSMATSAGFLPKGLRIAVFDIRPFLFDDDVRDESKYYYYLRDQKSLATRIPKVFDGVGYYFEGNHGETVVPLYQAIIRELESVGN